MQDLEGHNQEINMPDIGTEEEERERATTIHKKVGQRQEFISASEIQN